MKHLLKLFLFSIVLVDVSAQVNRFYDEDSLRALLQNTAMDTTRVDLLNNLAGSYFFKRPDSTLFYAKQALALARKLNYTRGIQFAFFRVGEANRHLGNLVEAVKIQSEAIEFNRRVKSKNYEANSLGWLGLVYFELHDYNKALPYLKQAVAMRKTIPQREPVEALFNIHIANIYNNDDKPDSALRYINDARKYPMVAQLRILTAIAIADIFVKTREMDSADYYYRRALKFIFEDRENAPNHLSMLGVKLAKAFERQNKPDSSLYFARYAFFIAKDRNLKLRVLEASSLLSQFFKERNMLDSAIHYQEIFIRSKDNIFSADNYQQLELLLLDEQRKSQEREREQERFQNNVLLIGLLSITTIILIASILLFRGNRMKQKTNLILQQALRELKATQSQLIQSEKMASLGELTAGIAHEIQNPLNFVNNFSELNKELIEEMNQQARKGNLDEVQKLAADIKMNEEKIEHHGKRADGIVKSMLQHSRLSSSQKELTDINELCDEYVRLTYHGYRVKEKSFNVKLDSNFDPSLPKLNVVRQDIGRVLLNLINNAFYAVNEKSIFAKATADKADGRYEPTVIVSTKNLGNKIEISVKDNGNGIPASVKEKIFQPFFTTKPTGQGSGLGLSLSYDIVKTHGGELLVGTNEGGGSEFIIRLPL